MQWGSELAAAQGGARWPWCSTQHHSNEKHQDATVEVNLDISPATQVLFFLGQLPKFRVTCLHFPIQGICYSLLLVLLY